MQKKKGGVAAVLKKMKDEHFPGRAATRAEWQRKFGKKDGAPDPYKAGLTPLGRKLLNRIKPMQKFSDDTRTEINHSGVRETMLSPRDSVDLVDRHKRMMRRAR